MAWVALDRAVKAVESFGLDGPVERWRTPARRHPRAGLREGFDPELGSFVQSYGSTELDASLLMIPLVGFLPADDPRVRGTVAAIEKHLMRDGFVARYDTHHVGGRAAAGRGGVPALHLLAGRQPASCWAAQPRRRRLFERLLGLRNDVGLLSEEYDP